MIWPTVKHLGESECVAGIVTLGAPDAAGNPANVARANTWLAERKVSAKWASHALNSNGFLADEPKYLANDLHGLLADPDVDFILTTGGGANANSILPHLDPDQLRKYPKPIVGLSNTTLLLNYLAKASGVITFHGPVLVWNIGGEQPLDDYSETHFRNALRRQEPVTIQPEGTWQWIKGGTATGKIWGGNLWSMQQLIGTPYMPDMAGAILFVEECFSELHNIAAVFNHFDQAGVFGKIAGLILGIPLECEETEMPDGRDFNRIATDACKAYNFPILAGVHLGHTDRKATIPVGATARISEASNEINLGD
jgi:muramoyltetrapeptide carboxypeptidase